MSTIIAKGLWCWDMHMLSIGTILQVNLFYQQILPGSLRFLWGGGGGGVKINRRNQK